MAFADVLWRHRRLLFNPRYGPLGLVVMPYFLLVELLAPMLEAVGLLALVAALLLGSVDLEFAALFFLVAYGYGLVLTCLTLALDEVAFHRHERVRDRLLLLLWAVLESVGYHQLTVVWRLRGLLKYLRRNSDWGVMTRRGFSPQDAVR